MIGRRVTKRRIGRKNMADSTNESPGSVARCRSAGVRPESAMPWFAAAAALLFAGGCDGQPAASCVEGESKPILEIASARDPVTGTAASTLSLYDITLDGVPIDTAVLRTDRQHNIERTDDGLDCTALPCSFGGAPGMYAFDVVAPGFYASPAEVTARFTEVPAGCPESHGRATTLSLALTEADSARVTFQFAQRRATGLPSDIASVTFDDGSGPRSIRIDLPAESYITRNAGTLHIRFVVGAPDTIATGEVDLPLMKDWEWSVGAYLYDRSPTEESFCIDAKSFPLMRPVPGADSLWVGWAGTRLSREDTC